MITTIKAFRLRYNIYTKPSGVPFGSFIGRDASEIDLDDGDLLRLSVATGAGAFRAETCVATNQTTGYTGQVNSCHLYVLATMTAPASEYLVRVC